MLWVKSFHLIALICWFSGLFYLPRLFVYHAMATDVVSLTRFNVMERKLYFGITTPSLIAVAIFGSWLVSFNLPYYLHQGWFHAKMTVVLLLVIYHILCGYYLYRFKNNCNQHSHRFFRIFNEIPVLFLIVGVVLAVVKPF